MDKLKQRWDLAKQIGNRPWTAVALVIWAIISAWDTAVSELLPASWANKAPKVYGVIEMTSGWLPFWGWLLVGIAILSFASFEFAFQWTREEDFRKKYQHLPKVDKGILDFHFEGTKSVQDVTRMLVTTTKHTEKFNRHLNAMAKKIARVGDGSEKKLKVARRTSQYIDAYAVNTLRAAEFIDGATTVMLESQTKFIKHPFAKHTVAELQEFSTNLQNLYASILPTTVSQVDGIRLASNNAKGYSADMNASVDRVQYSISQLVHSMRNFGTSCEQIRSVALEKLSELQKA
jgi:hypothetical protein